MSAAWEQGRCPRCARSSESSALVVSKDLPEQLGTQKEAQLRHGAGEQQHTWRVVWLEETRVKA